MKNFRSNYYEKVGFKAVDVKKALDSILSEPIVDKEKLSQFTLKYDVPAQCRIIVWKVLLDVVSCNRNASEFVWQQKVDQCELLLRGLRTMRKIDDEQQKRPDARTMSLMFALEENKLHLQSVRAAQKAHWELCFETSHRIISEMSDDSVEVYWLCRNMTHLLISKRNVIASLVQETESRLRRREPALHEHLQKLGFWKSVAVANIFQTAMANVFENEVASRVWDKFIAGSVAVQIFIVVECLINLEYHLLKIRELDHAERENLEQTIRQLSLICQLSFVDRALDAWAQCGCPTTVKSLEEETLRRHSISRKISKSAHSAV